MAQEYVVFADFLKRLREAGITGGFCYRFTGRSVPPGERRVKHLDDEEMRVLIPGNFRPSKFYFRDDGEFIYSHRVVGIEVLKEGSPITGPKSFTLVIENLHPY